MYTTVETKVIIKSVLQSETLKIQEIFLILGSLSTDIQNIQIFASL